MAKRASSLEKNLNLRHNFIFLSALLISLLSAITIFSVSKNNIPGIFQKHIANILLSIFVYFAFLKIKIPKKFFILYYLLTVFLLLSPLFISSSPRRWIRTSVFSFQPSEIAKIPFLISLSIFFENKEEINFRDSLKILLICFLPFLLVLIEPDMGSSIYYLFIFFVLIIFKKMHINIKLFYLIPSLSFIFSFNYISFIFFLFLIIIIILYFKIRKLIAFSFLLISILIGLATPFVWNKVLKDYQKERIKIFLNPSLDPKGAGWQITQGLITIGSGGISGKGFLKGLQKGLAFLPAAHTDFAFASFAEEFGFLGSLFLLSLYFFFFWNLIFISKYTDPLSSTFSLLLLFSFIYSFFLNLGGELALLPLTGIPLPFFSYGGTSFVTNFLLLSLFRNFQRGFFYKG